MYINIFKKFFTNLFVLMLIFVFSFSYNAEVSADNLKIKMDNSYIDYTKYSSTPYLSTDGKAMVPFRSIFEELGGDIDTSLYGQFKIIRYDQVNLNHSYTVYLEEDEQRILVTSTEYKEDANSIYTETKSWYVNDVAIKNVNGRVFIHSRAISEAIGIPVEWDNDSQTVTIYKNKQNFRVPSTGVTTKRSTIYSFDPENNNTNISQKYIDEVLRLVNLERTKLDFEPLTLDLDLTYVAEMKSRDMGDYNYYDHYSPNYNSPFDMMTNFGIKYGSAGENLAKGQTTPSEVVADWMDSEGHRRNILDTTFKKIGIGYYVKDGWTYWTQMFTD
ncbi:MAG: CAP domain-containing protein [Lachnospirales bacterium]